MRRASLGARRFGSSRRHFISCQRRHLSTFSSCQRRQCSSYQRRHLSTFYDSQSGEHVELPTGVQLHLSLGILGDYAAGRALQHVLRDGAPVRGLASVIRAHVRDASEAAAAGHEIAVEVENSVEGLAAVTAAAAVAGRATAILPSAMCVDPISLQLAAAKLADAGANVVLLSAPPNMDTDELGELVSSACEVDLVGVPMASRLGLRVHPGPRALELAKFAHEELGLLHFMACLANKQAPRPSELLKALGVARPDADYGKLMLAEHVPDAA